MARIDLPPEQLSDYERAVCYYTLPRITHPVTVGLIVVYAVCVLEALGALIYGLYWDNEKVTRFGAVAFAGMVVFGVVAFLVRALMNEVRQRRALAVARGVSAALEGGEGVADIPDPFESHILLRHPLHARGDLFPCTNNMGTIVYFVESAPSSPWWKVKEPQDNEVIRVRVDSPSASFSLGGSFPSRLSVYAEHEEVARIRRRFTFTTPTIVLECSKPEPRTYVFQQAGFYLERRLVGRVYYLHHSVYLDIDQAELHPGILGLFVTMT